MKQKRKIKYRETGITLVALVVTIIVLLILAGVTISLALGSNGIIEKAQIASNMYANVTKNETTMMGEIDEQVADLSNVTGGKEAGSGSGGGSTGLVVKDKDGAIIDLSTIARYYGHDVSYNGQTYQLFYVDEVGKYSNGEARIWLQYKSYVDEVRLSDHYETTGISTENSILWQVNPDLDSKYGRTIRAVSSTDLNTNAYGNFRGVAYLCNPERWNSTYVASADIAAGAYAIGGVSAEMFCDSYNAARGKISTDADYFDAKAFNKNSTYGYWYKPSGTTGAGYYEEGYGSSTDFSTYPISTDYGMMYWSADSCNPWLSSPSVSNASYVCDVLGQGSRHRGSLCHGIPTDAFGVRPAVSLPSNIQIQLES